MTIVDQAPGGHRVCSYSCNSSFSDPGCPLHLGVQSTAVGQPSHHPHSRHPQVRHKQQPVATTDPPRNQRHQGCLMDPGNRCTVVDDQWEEFTVAPEASPSCYSAAAAAAATVSVVLPPTGCQPASIVPGSASSKSKNDATGLYCSPPGTESHPSVLRRSQSSLAEKSRPTRELVSELFRIERVVPLGDSDPVDAYRALDGDVGHHDQEGDGIRAVHYVSPKDYHTSAGETDAPNPCHRWNPMRASWTERWVCGDAAATEDATDTNVHEARLTFLRSCWKSPLFCPFETPAGAKDKLLPSSSSSLVVAADRSETRMLFRLSSTVPGCCTMSFCTQTDPPNVHHRRFQLNDAGLLVDDFGIVHETLEAFAAQSARNMNETKPATEIVCAYVRVETLSTATSQARPTHRTLPIV